MYSQWQSLEITVPNPKYPAIGSLALAGSKKEKMIYANFSPQATIYCCNRTGSAHAALSGIKIVMQLQWPGRLAQFQLAFRSRPSGTRGCVASSLVLPEQLEIKAPQDTIIRDRC
jgi:hypothetical protein